VDDKLLKFHAGAVPWSPAIQKYRDCVEYWHQVLRTKTDVLTSRTAIKRLSIKIGEYSGYYLSTAEARGHSKTQRGNASLQSCEERGIQNESRL
jgi:hypothetical protein